MRSTLAKTWADALSGGVLSAEMHSGSQTAAMARNGVPAKHWATVCAAGVRKPARARRRKSAISAVRSDQSSPRAARMPPARWSGAGRRHACSETLPADAAPNGRIVSGIRWNSDGMLPAGWTRSMSPSVRRYAPISRCWPLSSATPDSATRRARPPSDRACSISVTRTPFFASATAAAQPAQPPPTTATCAFAAPLMAGAQSSTRSRACAAASGQCGGRARDSRRARSRPAACDRSPP